MTLKFLNLFVCLITILQITAAGVSISPARAGSCALLGTYTADCERVNDFVVSTSPLGEQFKCAAPVKPNADIFFAMPEIRKANEQALKQFRLPCVEANSFTCSEGFVLLDKKWSGPPGRSSPPIAYFILFAIILALSNLPAPVSCFARSVNRPARR